MLNKKEKEQLEKSGYRILGPNEHSAVKICTWTKNSILEKGICYKQKFYENIHGIKSHRCLQMTPSLPFCDNRCVFCWRNKEISSVDWKKEADSPEEIIEEAISAQRKLLSGFKGNPKANLEKWEEAQNPNMCAISLDGEPTLYPKINELIKECKEREITPFLVTNGMHPKKIKKIEEPAQIYVSLIAPDKKTYKKIARPKIPKAWKRLRSTLKNIQKLDCVTVLRLTLVKELNMKNPTKYANIIKKTKPDFVEPKGYMYVGHSRKRLKRKNMPTHEEIKKFSKKITQKTPLQEKDESEPSRVTLLKHQK